MKTSIIVLLLSAAVTSSAYADVFQFIDRSQNSYLTKHAVYISNQLCGYTDGYGRIRIERPKGNYTLTLKQRKKPDRTISISFDGSSITKVVSVP